VLSCCTWDFTVPFVSTWLAAAGFPASRSRRARHLATLLKASVYICNVWTLVSTRVQTCPTVEDTNMTFTLEPGIRWVVSDVHTNKDTPMDTSPWPKKSGPASTETRFAGAHVGCLDTDVGVWTIRIPTSNNQTTCGPPCFVESSVLALLE
jgi:hypothetical protein